MVHAQIGSYGLCLSLWIFLLPLFKNIQTEYKAEKLIAFGGLSSGK